jgi:hypothetical protein
MKKSLLFSVVFLVLVVPGFGKKVDVRDAERAAQRYLASIPEAPSRFKSSPDLTLVVQDLYYVFTIDSSGFVIMSGDDAAWPVLGYSFDSGFDPSRMPINLRKWLEEYKNQIRYVVENQIEASPEVQAQWEYYLDGRGQPIIQGTTSVNPLVKTRWDQSPYYNALCPGGSVTGCVATAMAQVMKYWNYPANGSGFHSYNTEKYGTLSANFGSTTYEWNQMPNVVTGPNSAVATLMHHCGVGVDMDYSPEVSGAYVISAYTNTENCAEFALKTYFGYKNTMQGLMSANFTTTEWVGKLRNELTSGRPILYAGFGSGGGHAFVCDGFDGGGNFHFNWGWGSAYDGYFAINALNPGGTGTGGGTGGYNSNHQAILGIEPPAVTQNFSLSLYNYVVPSASTINYGQAFTVSTNLANYGNGDFSGDYCAALFDSQYNFTGYVQILSNYNLQAGYAYTNNLTFSTDGLLEMLPGQYYIGIFCRPAGGNWIIVDDNGNYTNFVSVNVVHSNPIQLYSTITVQPGTTLVKGLPVTVIFDLVNTGGTTFKGTYEVNLYELDGTWVETIGTLEERNGLPSGYHYLAPYLNFYKASLEADPGTYLLAAIHKPSNSEDWELTGTGNFQNPIKVTVQLPDYQPDSYESNNSVQQAYNLTLSFTGNTASKSTSGANLHNNSDNDFYRLVLPTGYNYTITPRLHDKYNTGNGQTYTVDALYSWSSDGTVWSSTYDDIMTGTIQVKGGKTVYIHVAPYFAGETGTYQLDLSVQRVSSAGIEDPEVLANVRVFPNPASDKLFIELLQPAAPVGQVRITDMEGRILYNRQAVQFSRIIEVDLRNFARGNYILELLQEDKIFRQKFVKD